MFLNYGASHLTQSFFWTFRNEISQNCVTGKEFNKGYVQYYSPTKILYRYPNTKSKMIKKIKLDGKIVHFELFLPNEIKEFLSKNNIDRNELLNNKNWADYIIEDLEQYEVIDFKKAKIVINYVHIDQNNQIRVNPENFSKGKNIVKSSTINKGDISSGAISNIFSLGYSIFVE